jgi:hypothetical protein
MSHSRVLDVRDKAIRERSIIDSSSAVGGDIEKRRSSVHEQLRGDHIETLETLQSFVDENERLRKSVEILKKRLRASGNLTADGLDDCNDDVDNGAQKSSDDDSAFLLTQIGAKDRELAAVKGKLKASVIEIKDLKDIVEYMRKKEMESIGKVRYYVDRALSAWNHDH